MIERNLDDYRIAEWCPHVSGIVNALHDQIKDAELPSNIKCSIWADHCQDEALVAVFWKMNEHRHLKKFTLSVTGETILSYVNSSIMRFLESKP